jgi:hypothetical protein
VDHEIARGDSRLDLSVGANDQAVVAQINCAFDRTIQIKIFASGELALDLN